MSKEEKMMILQMVAEGKVTPEQGAELLRAVGENRPEGLSAPPSPHAPHVPHVPSTPSAPASPTGQHRDELRRSLDENIERAVETSVRKAEEAAEMATRRAEEFAQRLSHEGENIGKVLGESGENLGKILGRVFGGGWSFGGGNAFEFPEEIVGQFPPEGEVKVDLTTRNGKINVDTWDEPGFKLQVIRRVHAPTEEDAKTRIDNLYEFTQDGLRLTARTKELLGGFLGTNVSVHFALTLPRDRKADVRVSSANGRLTLESVSGSSLKASTANGRIESRRCEFGRADIDSANGRIEFSGRVRDLSVNTANGRVEADLEGAGNWVFGTANGRVELNVRKDPNAAYEVDASSVAGKVEVSGLDNAEVLVNDTRTTSGSRHYRARSAGYASAEVKGSIKATTASGRVTVMF